MAAVLTPDQAYEKLKERFRLLSGLTGASSILYMDSMTAMRPGSDSDRSEQMMALASADNANEATLERFCTGIFYGVRLATASGGSPGRLNITSCP